MNYPVAEQRGIRTGIFYSPLLFVRGRLYIMSENIKYSRDDSIGTGKPMGWINFLSLTMPVAAAFLLSACAALPLSSAPAVPIDQFPEYASQDGSYISPSSIDTEIPDVDILALNDEIRSLLDASVAGIKNPWNRLNELISIVSKNVRYDTQDDKFGTKTAIETFESGTGNCLSFINLFVSMARYVGIHSGYQDIRTPPNWIRKGEALFVTRHIGAFVDFYVPGQRAYTIDYAGNKTVVVLDNMNSFLIAPSLDKEGYEVGTYSTTTISDRRAFAQYYNNIGSQYLAEGKGVDAYRYFVKAIKTDPEVGFAWSNLGVVYTWNNQADAAEKAYLQAMAINSGKDDISLMTVMGNMAKLYSRTGRKEDAAIYEKEVTSFRDKNPYYHFTLGSKAFDDGSIEESVKQFKEAIHKKDDEHLFHYALAVSYIKLNDLKNAEKSLKKARSYAMDSFQKDYYDRVLDNLHKSVADDRKTAG